MKTIHFVRRFLLIFAALFLTACGVSEQAQWLDAPGWSRAQPVGVTGTPDPAPIAFDDEGQIYVAWFADAGGGELMPRVAAYNRRLQLVWETTIANVAIRGDDPQLAWANGRLNFLWLSDQVLHYVALDREGAAPAGLQVLSGETVVDDVAVAVDPAGQLTVWYAGSRRDPGLYALAPGQLSAPALVDPEGVRPSLSYDGEGVLHAGWAHYQPSSEAIKFYYGAYRAGQYVPGQAFVYREPSIPVTTILEGPLLALTDDGIYAVWSQLVRAGMETGRVDTRFVFFADGDMNAGTEPQLLPIPRGYDLDYEEVTIAGGLNAGPRFPLPTAGMQMTTNLSGVRLVEGGAELGVVFNAQTDHLYRKVKGQVGAAFLAGGNPTGYQLLSFSAPNSSAALAVRDKSGFLYASWQENSDGGNQIYLASTAPDIYEAVSGLSRADLTHLSAQTLFGLLSGALLAPFAIAIWMIAPLLIIMATGFMRRERGDVASVPGTLISVGITIVAYWFTKLFSIPGIRTYVPFSAWLPNVPSYLDTPLQVGVPLSISLLALLVAYNFTYRRGTASGLYFMGIFAVVDGLLTMMVYGLLILGAA